MKKKVLYVTHLTDGTSIKAGESGQRGKHILSKGGKYVHHFEF